VNLADRPWEDPGLTLPDRIGVVPGMLRNDEKKMLYWLARHWYTGQGAIVDLGSFLGGSTICFLTALEDRGETRRIVHAYDYWVLSDFERGRYFADNPPPRDLTRPIFEQNTDGYQHLLYARGGDLLNHSWDGEPIELLFVDIAKSYKTWDHIVERFFPSLIPRRSIVILQDYLWETTGPWHHVVMEKLSNHFQLAADTHVNSVLFLNTKGFGEGVLEQALWERIPAEEKTALMQQAIRRMDTPEKRTVLEGPREILASGKDMSWGMYYHRLAG
jgi:hypothetical protein